MIWGRRPARSGRREATADGLGFRAVLDPPPVVLAALAAAAPENPFLTPAYAAARRALGARVVALAEVAGETIVGGTVGFVRGNRLWPAMDLPSAPTVRDPGGYWRGVRRTCRALRVWEVDVGTAASTAPSCPEWPDALETRVRLEWHLALDAEWDGQTLDANHRRNAEKARRAGVRVIESRAPEAVAAHACLVAASQHRRTARGDQTPPAAGADSGVAQAMVAAGAGTLYQGHLDGEVVSSVLVLEAGSGAYYQSAGTSPEGMRVGASVRVVVDAARALAERGVRTFNLGGAGPDAAGLYRFKKGFGAEPVESTAVRYAIAGPTLRRLRTGARLLRTPSRLLRALVRVDRFAVYAARPDALRPVTSRPDLVVRPITMAKLEDVSRSKPEYAVQVERARRIGTSGAFAVATGQTVAHVAWLVDVDHDRHSRERNVRLRPGEVEITHCYTDTAARGSGVYPFAIVGMAGVAAARGAQRVFMITNVGNTASRRGIEKAGLTRCGTVWRIRVLGWSFALRGHRIPGLSGGPA